MIRVSPCPPPASLSEAAAKELEKNRKRLQRNEKLVFSVYGSGYVKDALNLTFHFKCAYCESEYGATQPVAIEHFRPKGRIKVSDKETRPRGYYWLAASWGNLLPSCTDCNSARRHPINGKPAQLLGKGEQFPLFVEARRATNEGGEKHERPLLLHPFLDDPDEHLEFIDEGVVRARKRGTRASRKGTASIRVFGLERPRLVQMREARQKLVRKQVERVKREAKRWQDDPGDPEQEAILRDEVLQLKAYVMADNEYAGMARQTLKPFEPELGDVDALLDAVDG
jgi:uncharacterized protein (TIGR02646 family)